MARPSPGRSRSRDEAGGQPATVERFRDDVVTGAAQSAGLTQKPRGLGEILNRRDLPSEVIETDGAARRARRSGPDREQPQVVVVVLERAAHEDCLPAHLLTDDLEA